MKNIFRKLFVPPDFPDDENGTPTGFILNRMGRGIITGSILLIIILSIATGVILSSQSLILLLIVVVTTLSMYISGLGYTRAASIILVTAGWIGLTALTLPADGIRDAAFFAYFLPILMSGLLLGGRWALGFTVASILSGLVLAYAETQGLIITTAYKPFQFAGIMTVVLFIAGVFISAMIDNLQNAVRKARANAHELSLSNKQLSALQFDLGQRVEERTAELRKRALQLEAVSSVARAIASVQNIDTLLPAVAKLISEQFGFYHVGIFLLDEKRESAILRASNSAGGLQMLSRQHSLPVDQRSIVGYSISRGEPRIALDVGADSVYFNNPDLPETRSEMALPLRITGRIIGSLDVQSTQTNAFATEDISVLTTLADQVAIAIENSRSFSEATNALNESRAMFDKYTQQEWHAFAMQVKQTGFIFDGKQVIPLEDITKREAIQTVVQTGNIALEKESASVIVPIKLRGQTIGVLDVRSKKGARQWKQDEISILEAAAERAALALENARLVQSAQRRAARERAIGDISAKIGAVSNLESILQVAVEELGRRIGGAAEVSLEINSDDDQNAR